MGYDDRKAEIFTKRESRQLTIFDPGPPVRTDDRIEMLIVQDVMVASVIYRRNDANYVCVSFAHYLDKNVIERTRWHESQDKDTD